MGATPGLDAFAGGDQAYLRDVQYRDSTRLAARASLHVKYGTARTAWFPWVATQIDWPVGARVLEVGCGAGWLWAEASAHLPGGLHLTLTDLSAGMVAEAVGRVAGLGRHRRVDGRIADAQALPFAADSFDIAVANHMLYHVPDPRLAVAELARVVRPDGVLIAGTVGATHLRELAEIRAEVFGGPGFSPPSTRSASRWASPSCGAASPASSGGTTTTGSTAPIPMTCWRSLRQRRRWRTPATKTVAVSPTRSTAGSPPVVGGCASARRPESSSARSPAWGRRPPSETGATKAAQPQRAPPSSAPRLGG